ncbi:MAG: GtrA family protein [Patescibacteria group bacterium]
MPSLSRLDYLGALITGATTGCIAWQIFSWFDIPLYLGFSWAWLVVLVPVLWLLGVIKGYLLGKYVAPVFADFGKFVAVGSTNAAVDFGIMYFLIAQTGIASGGWFSLFKTASFIVALGHSYTWNALWVFSNHGRGLNRRDFIRFTTVALVALAVNVGIASFVVNGIGPMFDLSLRAWAGVGAVAGSLLALLVSFTGFRKVVFA